MALQKSKQTAAALMETATAGLSEKVVFIAGGACGQGLLLAELFAGLTVRTIIGGEDTATGLQALAQLEKLAGGEVGFVAGGDWRRTVREAAALFGRLDLVINWSDQPGQEKAGFSGAKDRVPADYLLKFAAPELYKAGGGAIASIFWGRGESGSLRCTAGGSGKTAVAAFTKQWAAPCELHIRSICPGKRTVPLPGELMTAAGHLRQYFARNKPRDFSAPEAAPAATIQAVGFIALTAALFSAGGGGWSRDDGSTAC